MSHLQRIIEIKSLLQSKGCTCPKEHAKIIEAVFIRAGISFIFRTNRVTAVQEGNAGKILLDQLDLWNRVSPINGLLISASVSEALRQHFVQGCSGGDWTPVTYCYPAGVPESDHPTLKETYDALFHRLVQELCEGEI